MTFSLEGNHPGALSEVKTTNGRMQVGVLKGSFGLENLDITSQQLPQPGPHQVLIRVRATSLNYRDLLIVTGRYDPQMPLPRILFSDGAGEVVAVGDEVSRVAVGERVAGIFMQSWLAGPMSAVHPSSALGGAIDGMLAEFVVLSEEGVVRIPEHLSFEEAAALPCAAVTAWNALITQGRLQAGETVLIQGTGGVSLFALQFARMHGVRVIATSSSDEKLQRVRDLGASDTINYRAEPNWQERVLELTDGMGVDHVVEVGGAGTLAKSLSAVRTSGIVSLIGVLTGVSAEIPTAAILRKHIRVQGIFVGSREIFDAMNRAITLHKMQPVLDRIFAFTEFHEALRYLESGAHFGKIVVRLPE